jgi:1-acyl-sn-glycerol-3-phosphate acyltransferase
MGLVYQATYYITRTVAHLCFDFRVYNREAIPKEGGLLLAMNHQSFIDPPLAGIACDREVCYLARKSLFDVPVLGRLLPPLHVIPYDQSGSDIGALKAMIRVVKKGEAAVIFPEGTRTSDGELQPAQAGVGMVVAKTLAPVVPLRIFGAFDAFPRNSKSVRFTPVTLVVGDVLRFTAKDCEGDPRVVYKRVSNTVMEAIAALRCPPRNTCV